jgi:hypothetical protein
MRTKCRACNGDAGRDHEKKLAAWDDRVASVNAWRESKGREPLHFWGGPSRWFRDPPADDADVCARVFGGKAMWWDREPGYVADEVKRALRRTPAPKKAKRDKWGAYVPLDYTLPLPTLAAQGKRLAAGAHDAEEYVKRTRTELGLTLALPEPEPEVDEWANVAERMVAA